MFSGRRRHGGGGRGNFGVMLLFFQLMNYGFDRIPPVTLVTILGQVAIFLGIGDLTRWFPSSHEVCLSTHYVWRQGLWNRLVLSTLFHASDMHLYFNMVSMLWKGSDLERRFKSHYFAFLLVTFTILSSLTYVLLNLGAAIVFQDRSYELTCAVGFSGVLFALKVLSVHYSPRGLHYVMGFIPVPSKYVYWAELGIIHLIYPNASFTGHLAGILVGYLYIHGPLKMVMDSVMSPVPSYTQRPEASNHRVPEDRGYTTGHGDGPTNNNRGSDYDRYTGGLSEEEQIRRATEQSRQEHFGGENRQERLYPDLDDLRRRREQRYT